MPCHPFPSCLTFLFGGTVNCYFWQSLGKNLDYKQFPFSAHRESIKNTRNSRPPREEEATQMYVTRGLPGLTPRETRLLGVLAWFSSWNILPLAISQCASRATISPNWKWRCPALHSSSIVCRFSVHQKLTVAKRDFTLYNFFLFIL